MVAVIALTYSGLAIWISGGSVGTTESRIATPAPSPPFNINRSISLGNMTIIPRAADEPFTVIRMQLMPPLEDTLPDRYIINSVLLSFDNGGTEMDHNISLKLYLPGVREVSCDSDRIQVVEGNLGATFVNLLIPELKPDEKLSCKVDFTQIVSDIPTVTAWKKRFGSIHAWSELRQEFEVFIYRISFGPETPAPVGSGRKTMRAITNSSDIATCLVIYAAFVSSLYSRFSE